MHDLLPKIVDLAIRMDQRMLALLVFLVFLLILLAWKLLEGLAAVFFELVYSLTPRGRAAQEANRKAMEAEVDAIMARIRSLPAPFQGPPKPPARWQIWLGRVGWAAYFGWMGLWSYLAWHLYQSAQSTALRIAAEEARNPMLLSPLRGLQGDEPGKTYALATFLALQVLAVVIGSVWQWYKDHQPAPQNPLTHKPLA